MKQSKAMVYPTFLYAYRLLTKMLFCQVAAQTAGAFNPNVHIHPIHGNIKEPQYDIQWFQGFDIVLNALDNLGEPHHVAVLIHG